VIIVSKEDKQIRYANKHALKQYDIASSKILNCHITDIYQLNNITQDIIDKLAIDGYIQNSEEKLTIASGKEFTALLSVTSIIIPTLQSIPLKTILFVLTSA